MLRLKFLLLIALLVFAQSGLLAHQSDIKAHQAGHQCEVCLHGMALGHGLTSAPLVFTVQFGMVLHRSEDAATIFSAPIFVYSARAPPDFSST